MPHYVYILLSLKDNKYYAGETADVNERLIYHNSGRQRSTKKNSLSAGTNGNVFIQNRSIKERERNKELEGWN